MNQVKKLHQNTKRMIDEIIKKSELCNEIRMGTRNIQFLTIPSPQRIRCRFHPDYKNDLRSDWKKSEATDRSVRCIVLFGNLVVCVKYIYLFFLGWISRILWALFDTGPLPSIINRNNLLTQSHLDIVMMLLPATEMEMIWGIWNNEYALLYSYKFAVPLCVDILTSNVYCFQCKCKSCAWH